MHVPEHGQLHVLKSHVRAEPVRAVARLALVAFRRAGRRKRRLGRKVRLAEESGLVAGARERAGEPALAHRRIEIDAVVPHAVRERQEPVSIEAREGWHTRLGVMFAENRVPSRASASMCGVRIRDSRSRCSRRAAGRR
jgi:hypothetical protein